MSTSTAANICLKFDRTAEVKTLRLDTFCAQHHITDIDFIWADVQGNEREMILGGQSAFARVSYLYTEYSNEELYEGQVGLKDILAALPGKWEVHTDYGADVLLRNVTRLGPMRA